jgi:hypothetical protein
MKRTVTLSSFVGPLVAGVALVALAACSDNAPAPTYSQGRVINQDIEATHVVGPTVTSPAFTERNPTPSLIPWRNEEKIDTGNQIQQSGQVPQ